MTGCQTVMVVGSTTWRCCLLSCDGAHHYFVVEPDDG